jgi:hypothetical protein
MILRRKKTEGATSGIAQILIKWGSNSLGKRMRSRFSRSCVVAAAIVVASSAAGAQQSDTSRARVLSSLDSLITDAATVAAQAQSTAAMTAATLRAQPGNSVGSESAWGAGWGDFFGGVGYQERGRFSSKPDGSASVGFGLGNPQRDLGLEVGVNSATTYNQGLGSAGSISLKLHRILPGAYGIAVGVENVANWGGTDGGSSTYGVVSHTMKLRDDPSYFLGSIAWNVGVGNSRFLTQSDLAEGKKGVNAFGSMGVRLASRVSAVGDWTGQDLDAGLSIVPFHSSPLVLSVGFADLTHSAGDGARFVVGLGAGVHVLDFFTANGR